MSISDLLRNIVGIYLGMLSSDFKWRIIYGIVEARRQSGSESESDQGGSIGWMVG